MIVKALTPAEWSRTPYAKSEARDPDKAIRDILTKRKVVDIQTTQTTGVCGRPLFEVRFRLDGKVYRIGLETLDAPRVSADDLIRQVKRAIYHMLKSLLEFATVFAPVDQVLFGYMEYQTGTGNNPTMYAMALPQLAAHIAPNFAPPAALPPHRPEEPDERDV